MKKTISVVLIIILSLYSIFSAPTGLLLFNAKAQSISSSIKPSLPLTTTTSIMAPSPIQTSFSSINAPNINNPGSSPNSNIPNLPGVTSIPFVSSEVSLFLHPNQQQGQKGSAAPIPNAGKSQSVYECTTVMLDGSKSFDPTPSATILYYRWVQITGIPITLIGGNTPNPTFVAPRLPTATIPTTAAPEITLTFGLTVTDNFGLTSTKLSTTNVIVIYNPHYHSLLPSPHSNTQYSNAGQQPQQQPLLQHYPFPYQQRQPSSSANGFLPQQPSPYKTQRPQSSIASNTNEGVPTTPTSTATTSHTTTLALNTITSVPWSTTITVTGKLTDNAASGAGIGGKTITFTGTGAANLASVNTNTDGTFSASGKAPSTVSTGWTVQAHFAGDSTYIASDSSTQNYSTLKHFSALVLNTIANAPWRTKVTVTGKLTDNSAGNIGIGSKTITFTSPNLSPLPPSVTTSADGTFSSSFTASSTIFSGWQLQAHYAGDTLYNAANTAIHSYNTVKHTVSLVVSAASTVPWNGPTAFTATLTDSSNGGTALSGKTITFTGTGVIPSPLSGTTDATGKTTVKGTAPSTITTGWTYLAHYAGDSLYNSKDSSIGTYSTIKHTTKLVFQSLVPNIPWSRPTSFPVILTDTSNAGAALSGKTIHFTGTGVVNVADKITDGTGKATGTGVSPSSVSTAWTYQAQFAGDSSYNAVTTSVFTFSTVKHSTSLTLAIFPTSLPASGIYGVSGTLVDTTRATGLSGMTISFIADPPITISSTTTGTTGTYTVTGLTAPTTPGTYHITAHFAATSLYNAANSTVQSLTTTATMDQFGIKELYTSKANGEQWYINMQNPTIDPQFNPNGVTFTRNPDGSYKVSSSSVRLQVYTSSGYHQNLITTYDQQILAQKGYMQSPNDWKNVEITGYMKVNHFTTSSTNGAAHIELLARGGIHSSSVPCEGTAYHSNTYETGRVKFEKELEHTSGYTTNDPQISGATGTLQGKWIGIKAVFYTFQNGSVELEQWLDDKSDNINSLGNNWHRVLQFKDIGNWGGGIDNCGGNPTTIITWGGPITHFRWDNIDDMDIKDLSVREIRPPQ